MKILLILLLLLFIISCARPFDKEPSCGFMMRRGLRMKRVTLPLIMFTHKSVPASVYPVIQSAADTWNKTVGFELIQVNYSGVEGERVSLYDGRSVLYWVTNWTGRDTAWATTKLISSGRLIYDSDILINASHDMFSAVDLESVLIHEFGHALGLDHSTSPDSVMLPYLDYLEVRRDLTSLDKSNILCGYGGKNENN